MADICGISDFLTQAGTQYRIFDMGRRIQTIDAETFLAFEQGELAYPFPLQQQAWLGMLVWTEDQQTDPVIWFLRFPLDARGCLTSGIRDDFVYRLLNKEQLDEADEASNPYGFKPKQEHMAVFHARVAKMLGQAASQYYAHARDYFAGKPGFEQWAFVGFQGIADIACRLDEDDNTSVLQAAIAQLPDQPFDALCQCLEHVETPEQLGRALSDRLSSALQDPADAYQVSMCLRALSNNLEPQLIHNGVKQVLASGMGSNPEVLASISGRCWLSLHQPELMLAFLERLAACDEGQALFNPVIVDLINIPGMQDHLNQAIRNPKRSEQLSSAIGQLFQDFTQ